MDKFLAQFSKNTLAIAAIGGGILFIILAEPPISVCKTQMEFIKNSQKLMLFKQASTKKSPGTKYICYKKEPSLNPLADKAKAKEVEYACTQFESLRDRCKRTNEPGGCYELFQSIKILLTDLDTLTRECASAAGSVAEVQSALWDSMNLIVRLAWGAKPPESYHAKFAWLDTADISLFCKLKAQLQNTYGESKWNKYRDTTMRELPGAEKLTHTQLWELSIFSENCARYP